MVDINEVNPGHVLFEIANCGNGGYKILEFHIKEVHSYQDSNESYLVEVGGDSVGQHLLTEDASHRKRVRKSNYGSGVGRNPNKNELVVGA